MTKHNLDAVDEEHVHVVSEGQRFLIGSRQDIPQTTPDGERRYIRHTTLVADADGSEIDLDSPNLVRCSSCAAYPLRAEATRTCAQCERAACLSCVARIDPEHPEEPPHYLCGPCARRARRQALVRFFFSVR
jgi:methionyl-tRNA synthetase